MEEEEMKRYLRRGMIVFSIGLRYDAGNKRKEIRPPKGYNLFTKRETYYDGRKSGIAIRMGTEIKKGRYIILIDVDNKETTVVKNGMELWRRWKEADETIEETPNEETPTKGRHYYYYVDEEQRRYLRSSGTTTRYKNETYAIDYKFERQFSIIAPSYYYKNGEKQEYKWIKGDLTRQEIKRLPECIYETIKERAKTKREKQEYINIKDEEGEEKKEFRKVCEIDEIKKYLKYIGRQDEYERWRNVGYIIKNLNADAYEIYDEWSRKSNKYSNDIKKFWESHKVNNSITIRALKHYVKIDKMEGYREVIEEEEEERIFKPIK